MDFKQLECFVHVVEKKSFSKASEALYISQPAVTSNIQKLENWLKIKLINRHGKEISMTAEGELLYFYAKELLKLREKALSDLLENRNLNFGRLSINSSSIPAQYLLPKLISGFKASYPNIHFDLRVAGSGNVFEELLAGRINVGFVGTELKNKTLQYVDLYEDELLMICSKEISFPADTISLEELRDFDLILREDGSATRRLLESALQEAGKSLSFFSSVSEVESSQTIKAMVALSCGIGFVSALDVQQERELGLLNAYKVKELPLKRTFQMVYAKDRHFSPVETAFIDFVLSWIKREAQ